MATTYTATKKVSCWKQHRCGQCGSLFRYAFERTIKGQAGNAAQASINLEAAIVKSLEKETDIHPCPQCGTVQPDMTAQSKRRSLFWVLLITLIVGLILFVLGASGGVPANQIAWVLACFGLIMAGTTYLILARNPNADPRANLAKAATAMAKGKLALDEVQHAADPTRSAPGAGVGVVTLVALAFAVCAIPFAEVARVVSGWPLNPEFHFPVIGPGDSATLTFPGSMTTVKSNWNGIGSLRLGNANELPAGAQAAFRVSSHTGTWGSTISVKSREKNSGVTPWIEVHVPDMPELAGKRVDLSLSLRTNFPTMNSGGTGWSEVTKDFKRDTSVQLASAGAGRMYEAIWYFGTLVGLLIICAIVFLSRRGFASALGTSLHQILMPAAPTPPAAPAA